jgi:hypothetical protein
MTKATIADLEGGGALCSWFEDVPFVHRRFAQFVAISLRRSGARTVNTAKILRTVHPKLLLEAVAQRELTVDGAARPARTPLEE